VIFDSATVAVNRLSLKLNLLNERFNVAGVACGGLESGQDSADKDVDQFLRLVDLVRGVDCTVRVGGIQLEDQTILAKLFRVTIV